jgi:hypothetical protein
MIQHLNIQHSGVRKSYPEKFLTSLILQQVVEAESHIINTYFHLACNDRHANTLNYDYIVKNFQKVLRQFLIDKYTIKCHASGSLKYLCATESTAV